MFSLSLYGALFLVLAVIGLLALALACAVSRPGSPVNTVRLTAPIFLEDNSPLYDVESMPRGRWGGATGGQWVFQFDGRRYKQERFDAFILRRSEESGVHEPVSHFECTIDSDSYARGEMHIALVDAPPFYRVLAGKEVARVQSRSIPL